MANIQKQFEQFDDAIRLKPFGEDSLLRKRRDAILNRITERFAAMRKEGRVIPTFVSFNQGSYEMGLGIVPADGDFDIDVGMAFNVGTADYPNPVELKKLVFDALDGHTDIGVKIRRSCVTIYYKLDGEQGYHVDLAIYALSRADATDGQLFLAKGKLGADEKSRSWEPSDPKGLLKWVSGRFKDKEAEQYRRIVRCLKRWKTERFAVDGNGAPTGISLTVAAGLWLQPRVIVDALKVTSTPDDMTALRNLVTSMIVNFGSDGRLRVSLPVTPYNDLLAKMTGSQMVTMKSELASLGAALDAAAIEADPVEACKIVHAALGDEFPVPKKEETAQSRGRAIASSGVSA